jgi:glycosyltransferase involved in cell wall biosynthesis
MVSLVGEHGASVIAKSGVYYRPTTVDGDSVALREALVMGVPVVASDATQRPSGVEVVGVGDWAAAAEAIMGALDDADEDGKEEGTVGDNECVERLVNIYSRILK